MTTIMLDPTETLAIGMPLGRQVSVLWKPDKSYYALIGDKDGTTKEVLGFSFGPLYLVDAKFEVNQYAVQYMKEHPGWVPHAWVTGTLQSRTMLAGFIPVGMDGIRAQAVALSVRGLAVDQLRPGENLEVAFVRGQFATLVDKTWVAVSTAQAVRLSSNRQGVHTMHAKEVQ